MKFSTFYVHRHIETYIDIYRNYLMHTYDTNVECDGIL